MQGHSYDEMRCIFLFYGVVLLDQIDKIRFFKTACKTKDRFHISIGHFTVMATAHFFGMQKSGRS